MLFSFVDDWMRGCKLGKRLWINELLEEVSTKFLCMTGASEVKTVWKNNVHVCIGPIDRGALWFK